VGVSHSGERPTRVGPMASHWPMRRREAAANVVRISEGLNTHQVPAHNAEHLQMLRYETGQFYRVRYDQNTAMWLG
jgi:hypothetical protein